MTRKITAAAAARRKEMEELYQGVFYYQCIGGETLPEVADRMIEISKKYGRDCKVILNGRVFTIENGTLKDGEEVWKN